MCSFQSNSKEQQLQQPQRKTVCVYFWLLLVGLSSLSFIASPYGTQQSKEQRDFVEKREKNKNDEALQRFMDLVIVKDEL